MKPRAEPVTQIVEKLQFGETWRQIQQEFLDSGRAAGMADGLTRAVDAMLLKSYESTVGSVLAGSGAVIAIGGFGRRELFPHSDVCIVILHPAEPPARLKPALSEFIRHLWDAGFRVSHSAGSIPDIIDACKRRPEFGIDLLDRRFLSGDSGIQAEFETRMQDFLGEQGPSSVRCSLHYGAERDSDVLDFEAQEAMSQLPFHPFKTSKEWMGGYFRNACIVFNATRHALDACGKSDRSVLEEFRDWQSRAPRIYHRVSSAVPAGAGDVFRRLLEGRSFSSTHFISNWKAYD